ncbi:iron-containing redox enzyme family protein [Massilia sp. CCM 8734]|uniref:iron-containing redox enzyme family protein n=1 Tax=Massilia sp. CCM 8734 TaxID=2609283 RepID=UPI001E49BD19|nr:iron-containing redox enzyme family protein [Massilia sp. CCM 8734]
MTSMQSTVFIPPHFDAPRPGAPAAASCRALYDTLSQADLPAGAEADAQAYLVGQLARAAAHPCDLPDTPAGLDGWIAPRGAAIGAAYQHYLAGRREGAPRRFFTNKSHALYFLRCVAPTKLVDGAWLYGTLQRWQENDFRPLVKTYVEELGDGLPDKNHVTLYQRLLDNHGCAEWDDLGGAHFTQGALQLALACAGDAFLPEMIGYNLGYEQLPLHLLITAYELNELGIDPYYFTLHITVDNGSTGHARDAVDALARVIARAANPAEFYRRVREGYKLNELGENTASVIASFDLEQELVRILAAKAVVGQNMHSDYCRVAGKTINAWLADPRQIPTLLRAFQTTGWIKRGAAPHESRFWGLLQGDHAEMFGVFSSYELQVLADWIASPAQDGDSASPAPRVASFRARQRAQAPARNAAPKVHGARALIRYPYAGQAGEHEAENDQLRKLEQAVALAPSTNAAMKLLTAHMSPARHHTPTGLMATRMFVRLLG